MSHTMRIEHKPNIGFDQMCENIKIKVRYADNTISFEKDGESWTLKMCDKVKLEPYQEQYGITVSPDNDCFFIATWEKGLFCFCLRTGSLLWQEKICHAEKMFLSDENSIICFFRNYGVKRLDISTGRTLVGFLVRKDDCNFWQIDSAHFLIGPIRRNYLIIDSSLKIKNKIGEDTINPNHYDTCIIHDMTYNGKHLEAEITEYSNDTMLQGIKDGSELPRRIKRTISLEH